VLTAGSLLVLVVDVLVGRGGKSNASTLGWVSLAVIGATLYSLTPFTATRVEVAHGLLAVDNFALFFKAVFLIAAAITVLISIRYLEIEGASPGEYFFLILCATLGMMIMAGGIDLITIFIGLETMAVSFYILAGFIKPSQRSNEAAVKYFLLGAFSLGILLYGMSLMYGIVGNDEPARDGDAVCRAGTRSAAGAGGDSGGRPASASRLRQCPSTCGRPTSTKGHPHRSRRSCRSAQKPRHLRCCCGFSWKGCHRWQGDWKLLFAVLSILTMTVGNVAAVTQSNIKRMLAYSSIAHAGYLLMGVVAGTTRGVTATLIYLLVYTFMQLGAFAVVIMLRRADVVGDELKDFSGLHLRNPFAAFAMLLFMLSLGGIPPTAGFMGKFWLFSAAIDAHWYWLAVIGVLNSAISLYYYIRIVVFMYVKKETMGSEPVRSAPLTAALAVAVVMTLVIGVYPRLLFELADLSAKTLGVAELSPACAERMKAERELFHKVRYTLARRNGRGVILGRSALSRVGSVFRRRLGTRRRDRRTRASRLLD
jgi:NADH-quinone oxidoreductase subunit N